VEKDRNTVDLFVRAKAVVTPDSSGKIHIYEPGYIAIDDGKIVSVGTYSDSVSFRGKEYLSLPEHVVFPGFINCHTHSPMVLFRGFADDLPLKEWLEKHIWPLEGRFVSPEFVKDGSLIGCSEMALSGVTFFSDMYFAMEKVAESARKVGIKAQIGEGILEFPTPTSPTVEHAFERTKRIIDEFKNDDHIYPMIAPHAPYTVSENTLRKAFELASENSLPLHIHLAEEKWELESFLSDKGMSSIAYLDNIGFFENQNVIAAHVNWLNEGDEEILAKHKVGVAHNPRSNMKLATGICPVEELLSAGVQVGLGTDGAASNNRLSVLEEAQTAALLHKIARKDPTAVSARKAFLMATILGAKAVKMEHRIGSLEEGKDADIIAVNFDKPHLYPLFDYISHLVYAVRTDDIEYVYVNGKPVVFKSRLVNVEKEELKEISEKYRKKIAEGA
jgi:5-methylthioadenosine/S-adenosylhomocysteine deaminase